MNITNTKGTISDTKSISSFTKASFMVKLYNPSKARNIACEIRVDHFVIFRILRVIICVHMLGLNRVDYKTI